VDESLRTPAIIGLMPDNQTYNNQQQRIRNLEKVS